MASQNDIVWLALHASELTRAQIDGLDLSMLRSFEPKGMGFSVEMFKAADCEADKAEVDVGQANFIQALNTAAAALRDRS